MPDAPAPAPAPEQELDQEPGLRDLLTTLAGNVQSIQDRGIAAEAKLELLTGQINLVVNATNTNAEGLAKLQAFVAASKTADPAADPADLLDWPPHFGGRDENPFPTRPRGVTDRPQLFKLDQLSPVYDYLRKKGSAAYHEIGTDVPILSYLWDALFLFNDWLPTFAEAVGKTPDVSKRARHWVPFTTRSTSATIFSTGAAAWSSCGRPSSPSPPLSFHRRRTSSCGRPSLPRSTASRKTWASTHRSTRF